MRCAGLCVALASNYNVTATISRSTVMFSRMGRKRAYWQALFLVLVLACAAQAGRQWQSGGQAAAPGGGKSADIVPRMMSVSGAGAASGATSAAPAFQAGMAVKHDVSAPLRDVKPVPVAPWSTVREMPERDAPDSSKPAAAVKDPVVQRSFGAGAL